MAKKLLDQLSDALRTKHYSFATHVLQRGGLAVKSPLDT